MGTTRNHNRIARPQQEATVLIEGTTAKIIPCTAKVDFQVSNSQVKAGEKFYLVRSERRANRYYVVYFCEGRNTYGCSCGCGTCQHEHLSTVRQYIIDHVVVPAAVAKAESSEQVEVIPMTVPATVAEIRKARKAVKVEQTNEQYDGSRQITAAEYKEIVKRDKARQRREKDADWARILEARAQAKQEALAG